MAKAIYVSIYPSMVEKIVLGVKNYEFRNYIPKKEFDTLYVYTTSPVCCLKYVLKIKRVIKYPDKILKKGYGNEKFNSGNFSKYAYEIDSVYELSNGFSLRKLKEQYNFTPPQAFAYSDKYSELSKIIESMEKKKII